VTNPTQMPKKESPVPQPIPPKCPYCGHVLAEVGLFSWISPPWMILNVNCSNPECRAVLHMQIVPVVGQQQQEETLPGPRLHLPS
jgi:hypothetical protein